MARDEVGEGRLVAGACLRDQRRVHGDHAHIPTNHGSGFRHLLDRFLPALPDVTQMVQAT
jgi:hypothetical protein